MKRNVNVKLLKQVIGNTSQGQVGFAVKAQVSVATVNKACNGVCPSRFSTLEKFCTAGGTTIEELFPAEGREVAS